MQTLTELRALLESRGLSPRHKFGQNFLVDQNMLRRLVDASGVRGGDVVLEIGPGTGVLTEALLESGASVVACEFDHGLFELLTDRLASHLNERLVLFRADALGGEGRLNAVLTDALRHRAFKLVANLPYGVATPVILDLATRHRGCSGMFVTVQRETGARFRAGPGTKEYGIASVLLHATMHMHRVATLGPACFWPRPNVTSEMVAMTRRERPMSEDLRALRALLERVFQHRRKQLGKTLGRDFPFPPGIAEAARPESLTPEQLVVLADAAREQGLVA